ncbi:MAG: GNAT family N-acetyltransferase [Sphingomonadaceae bacterium]|nr:GNAT family N-acetyltransferase [Sphingomonadaceae bacterium]
MFAITDRLLLRPGWIEDAPELTEAIAHKSVIRNLAQAPWPYRLEDAEGFLLAEQDPYLPNFQMIDRVERPGRMIGGIGFHEQDGEVELGYWLTPDYWGRGLTTEAGIAAIDAARIALGHRHFVSGHFVDNPASGNVLCKLGFRPTGRVEPRFSRGRGHDVDCVLYELDTEDDTADIPVRMEPALAA